MFVNVFFLKLGGGYVSFVILFLMHSVCLKYFIEVH